MIVFIIKVNPNEYRKIRGLCVHWPVFGRVYLKGCGQGRSCMWCHGDGVFERGGQDFGLVHPNPRVGVGTGRL